MKISRYTVSEAGNKVADLVGHIQFSEFGMSVQIGLNIIPLRLKILSFLSAITNTRIRTRNICMFTL